MAKLATSKEFAEPPKTRLDYTKEIKTTSLSPLSNSEKKEEPIELLLNHLGKEGKSVLVEFDIGASVSIISSATWTKLFPGRELKRTNTVLKTFSGEQLQPIGSADVNVQYKSQYATLPILVLEGEGLDLFG